MPADPLHAPDLAAITAAFLTAGAEFVVIEGFAVIANRHIRTTGDVDLLIPDDPENDDACLEALSELAATRDRDAAPVTREMLVGRTHLRANTHSGLVDLVREGVAPLDYATVARIALHADLGAACFQVASLSSVVGFKRLAGRPQDRADLAELEAIHGALPIDPIPGLDS
jgi:hypothetical protein